MEETNFKSFFKNKSVISRRGSVNKIITNQNFFLKQENSENLKKNES